MLMLGSKFAEVVDLPGEGYTSDRALSFSGLSQASHSFLASCEIEGGAILRRSFQPAPYPFGYANVNPFCPVCLQLVTSTSPSLSYQCALLGKTYLAHALCLPKDPNACLAAILDEPNHAKLAYLSSAPAARSMALGDQEYYLELAIGHSLTGQPFFCLKQRLLAAAGSIVWNLQQPEGSYFPNLIAFPFPDFDCTVTSTRLDEKKGRIISKAFVNLHKLRFEEGIVRISTDELEIVGRIHCNLEQQRLTLDSMNFKSTHIPSEDLPLLELLTLTIKLPVQDSDEEDYLCGRQNSSIASLLKEDVVSECSLKTGSKQSSCRGGGEHVDLPRLINNHCLGDYVRSSSHSRIFQAFLTQASPEQVGQVLQALAPQFCQLVSHDYANYMMQKLFGLCDNVQRMFLLRQLAPQLPNLAKNKQGTHTLQAFSALLSGQDEWNVVMRSIQDCFIELSEHPNATHLLQKIIMLCPLNLTMPFIQMATHQLLRFALQKNAMCVMKQMMRRLSHEQGLNNHIGQQLLRQLLRNVTLNIGRVIQDCYGNYIVQFCFQLFGEQRCEGITEMILERFPQFAIQKYSGSVILRCVENYWSTTTIDRLKPFLSNGSVIDMYRNKEGNRVLLALMERNEVSALREKVYGQLVMAEPSKFQQDRWGVTLGCRSGTVGTEWNSFSDAVRPRKKRQYDIIHSNIIQ